MLQVSSALLDPFMSKAHIVHLHLLSHQRGPPQSTFILKTQGSASAPAALGGKDLDGSPEV